MFRAVFCILAWLQMLQFCTVNEDILPPVKPEVDAAWFRKFDAGSLNKWNECFCDYDNMLLAKNKLDRPEVEIWRAFRKSEMYTQAFNATSKMDSKKFTWTTKTLEGHKPSLKDLKIACNFGLKDLLIINKDADLRRKSWNEAIGFWW